MSTDAPVFRPATEEDRPTIHRLHRLTEVWDGDRDVDDDLGPKFAADDVKYVDRWSAERDGAIIAEIGGDVAGGAWLRHFTADDPGSGYISDEIPEVAIALEPDFTGRGLGKKLMAAALDFARDRGAPGVSLVVDADNERAYRSYLAAGFEFVGAGPDDVAAGADAPEAPNAPERYVMLHRF